MIIQFVVSYGYLAVLLGTMFEGETVLLAAGFACHRGLLDWRIVSLLAVLGATAGDQCAFMIGRWKGTELLSRFPSLARALPRIDSLIKRYHAPMIVLLRFVYGMRIAGPVLLGTNKLSVSRFAAFNLIGAVMWVGAVLSVGYFFGVTIAAMVSNVREVEEAVLAGLVLLGGGFWVFRVARRHRPADRNK